MYLARDEHLVIVTVLGLVGGARAPLLAARKTLAIFVLCASARATPAPTPSRRRGARRLALPSLPGAPLRPTHRLEAAHTLSHCRAVGSASASLSYQASVQRATPRHHREMAIVEYDTGSKGFDGLLTFVSILILVMLSGLFSGLTLGLLGLDLSELEIVKGGGSATERRRAAKVMGIRKDGNRLLCTLLLGNVAVNALLSIFLSGVTSGLIGFCVSTALIVVFGEILPQAICSRHALKIGELALPIVNVIMVVLAPVSVPLKTVLDKLLGDSVGTIHTKTEMIQYVKLQHERGDLNEDERTIMQGAMDMKVKTAREVMTPLEDAYMLEESCKLSFAVVRDIFDHGFSRVPVYARERQHVVGLLFVKDLIFVDPEDDGR